MAFSWKQFFIIEEHHVYIFFVFLAMLIGMAYLRSGHIVLGTESGPSYSFTIAFYLISAAVFYFIYCWILYGWDRHFKIKKN